MKFSSSKLVPLTIGIVGFVWALGILLLVGGQENDIAYAGTLLFGVLAIVAAIVYLTCFRYTPSRQAEEIGALSIIVSVIYVVVVMVVNTIMMLVERGTISLQLLMINIVIAACYAIVLLYVERDVRRTVERMDRTGQKTAMPIHISGKLGALLGMTTDSGIRSRLMKLKEAVDYGSNITTANTAVQEQQMIELLDELTELIGMGNSGDAALLKIQQIEQCWKMRSSSASSIR